MSNEESSNPVELTASAPERPRVSWTTHPWQRDWVMWLFAIMWLFSGCTNAYKQGKFSTISLAAALIDFAVGTMVSFLVAFITIALPLLIIRRIIRGVLVKRAARRDTSTKWTRAWTTSKPVGSLARWVPIIIVSCTLLAWIVGRSDNVMVKMFG